MADITGTFLLGPDAGRILIKTGRAGLAARAGHDLTLEMTRWSARVTIPDDDGVSAATISAELDLSSLAVREGTGGAKPLSDKDRRDIENTARKILVQEPPRLCALLPELPEALEAIVARALQKDLRARYQSWFEFERDLADLARGLNEPLETLSDARKFHAVRELSFFRGFREIEIWETLRMAGWRRLPDGAAIAEQGARGDAMYILVEGRAEVTRAGARLATLGAGDLFGEILYFANDIGARSSTVRALGPVLLLELKAAALNLASDACQVQFNKAFMRLLVERLSQADRRG